MVGFIAALSMTPLSISIETSHTDCHIVYRYDEFHVTVAFLPRRAECHYVRRRCVECRGAEKTAPSSSSFKKLQPSISVLPRPLS